MLVRGVGGFKRDLVLNVSIWSLYIIIAETSLVFTNISEPTEDLGPMVPLEVPLANDQASAHLGPRGVHIAFIS